jgi:hypothetical protein
MQILKIERLRRNKHNRNSKNLFIANIRELEKETYMIKTKITLTLGTPKVMRKEQPEPTFAQMLVVLQPIMALDLI